MLKVVLHYWQVCSSSAAQRRRDPAEGNPWGGRSPVLRPLSQVVWLPLRCVPWHPPVCDGGGREALLQPGKAGQVAPFITEPFFFLSLTCLPGCNSLVLHEWFIWLSILLPALVCKSPRQWERMAGWAYVGISTYTHIHGYTAHPSYIYVCISLHICPWYMVLHMCLYERERQQAWCI